MGVGRRCNDILITYLNLLIVRTCWPVASTTATALTDFWLPAVRVTFPVILSLIVPVELGLVSESIERLAMLLLRSLASASASRHLIKISVVFVQSFKDAPLLTWLSPASAGAALWRCLISLLHSAVLSVVVSSLEVFLGFVVAVIIFPMVVGVFLVEPHVAMLSSSTLRNRGFLLVGDGHDLELLNRLPHRILKLLDFQLQHVVCLGEVHDVLMLRLHEPGLRCQF